MMNRAHTADVDRVAMGLLAKIADRHD